MVMPCVDWARSRDFVAPRCCALEGIKAPRPLRGDVTSGCCALICGQEDRTDGPRVWSCEGLKAFGRGCGTGAQ